MSPSENLSSSITQSIPKSIDSHHHLWTYSPAEYPWIEQGMEAIQQDFTAEDLRKCLQAAHIDGTVVVQARQTMEETERLLQLAAEHLFLYGVVGWAPIQDAGFAYTLEKLVDCKKLVGLRHVVQAEADGFLDQDAFHRGISLLRDTKLVYDILILEHQLEEAIRFVDRHPNQQFVLDHGGKPKIRNRELDPWRKNVYELSKRPNVACKISGLVTEADWHNWSVSDLKPYLDVCYEAFGSNRLMIGSDWPVCLVAAKYESWWQLMRTYFAALSNAEKFDLFGGTCSRIYNLNDQVTTQ